MTFPSSSRIVFDRNPLEEVICQLKFPTILEISAEKPVKFQNQIRDSYPFFELDESALPKDIAELVARLPIPKPIEGVTYRFLSEDRNRLISLAPEFVAFSDKGYVRWERFSREIARAQKALEEIYRPAFYTRVGLRYRDVVDRQELGLEDESWEGLLQPSLIGLLGARDEVGNHIREIRTESSIRLDEVVGAFATVRHGLGRTEQGDKQVYFIDTDFYTTERTSSQDVSDILRRFNQLNGYFFRWVTTTKLRDAMGPRDLEPED
jgi:uncharacterized protein (TIGR04255 family)